jgi:hypothetical protein
MIDKETTSKKSKPQAKVTKKKGNNLIELKITHILPKYEKSKDVKIYDGDYLTVWQDKHDINFWIGGTIALLSPENWEEIKREMREMLLKDIKIKVEDSEDD